MQFIICQKKYIKPTHLSHAIHFIKNSVLDYWSLSHSVYAPDFWPKMAAERRLSVTSSPHLAGGSVKTPPPPNKSTKYALNRSPPMSRILLSKAYWLQFEDHAIAYFKNSGKSKFDAHLETCVKFNKKD
jgi:hypothetical protein